MNYSRLGLAALGGMVASFAFGFLVLWLVPALMKEGHKYPGVFRPKEEMMTVMPIGLVATFIAILVVAIIFAMIHQGGSGTMEGARFGVLIGIFVVCAFVLHNYVNLNIGMKLALGQAVAYFLQWTIIGIVIGLIYKPPRYTITIPVIKGLSSRKSIKPYAYLRLGGAGFDGISNIRGGRSFWDNEVYKIHKGTDT